MSKVSEVVLENRGEITRFFKFGIVGAIGAVVDFSVLNVLVLAFGVPKEYANIVSVTCAIVSNFTWNRLWTFPESRERALHTQFGQFALVNLFGLAINQAVFILTDSFFYEKILAHPFDYNAAKATAIIVVLFWNFFVNRRTTYKGI